MRARSALPTGVTLWAVLAPGGAAAELDASRRSLSAARAVEPPRIDGRLDDGAWLAAAVDDRFVQEQPLARQPPTERTELRVTYDDHALYVAFDCQDSLPRGVVARPTRRDREVESDWVRFVVDSRDDRSTGYAFRVNAAGVQHDAIYFNDAQVSAEWDAVWSSAVTRHDRGWSAEFKIPLSVIRFPARAVQSWGFQAMRYISRKKELIYWQYVDRNAAGFVSLAGRLDGLTSLEPRRTFELRPYLAARVSAASDHGGALLGYTTRPVRTDEGADLGVDMKLGLTSDLTLDGTINPDFGQVEADQVVLNLTRYETFFPEKRPFFLESLDLFQMPVAAFYTRRIGRPPSGLLPGMPMTVDDGRTLVVRDTPSALRILGAAKLTGKVSDRLQVGVVAALTDEEEVGASAVPSEIEHFELAPRRGYAVGRLRYDFGGSSYLGAMATAVNRLGGTLRRADADHDAYTQVLDGTWLPDPHWRLSAQLMLSERVGGPRYHDAEGVACDEPGGPRGCVPITRADGTRQQPGDVGYGGFLFAQLNKKKLFARAQLTSYSPELDLNDLGFLTQWNLTRLHAFGGVVDREPRGIFQTFEVLPGGVAAVSHDGVLRDLELFVYTEALFQNYLFLSLEPNVNLGVSHDTLETFDGARFERDTLAGAAATVQTDSRLPLVLDGSVYAYANPDGAFEAGARAALSLQLVPQLELTLTPEAGRTRALRFYDCVTPSGNRCTIDDASRSYRFARQESTFLSFTLRGSYSFSPALSVNAYAQLFMDRGSWSDYRRIETTGLEPTIRRDELMPIGFAGDLDGDGKKDDDFQDVALNLNLVLRWEFSPGSTVIGVFTRAQQGAVRLDGAPPRISPRGLGDVPTEDVLLLKLVYFIG
jgi:hypothetical protein